MKASDTEFANLGTIPTSIAALDELLGGGIHVGHITELFGKESVGKSTLALQIIAAAQQQGIPCLLADSEYQFTPDYAATLGIDCDKLELVQFRIGEETFDEIERWASEKKNGLIVLDSMGGILPKEEAEKSAESKSIGLQSRLMASHCRKIIGLLMENRNAYIIVNHQVTNLTTGSIGSSGGAKLEHHKTFSIWLKASFGKNISRGTDGTKNMRPIEAELKKEKGMKTFQGKKAQIMLAAKKGFIADLTALPVKKRGRPAKI